MKVCGFSFIRNAIKFDYPIVESIRSVLPACDTFVIAVGNSEDDTLDLIRSIKSNKIRIIETVWDEELREGGRVLALETDKAFQDISNEYDWAFYIQGDEVLHEKYLPEVQQAMLKWKNHKNVEGLLFRYLHFYGSYDFVGDSRKWYRREVRIIRNNKSIKSYRDAQGFRKNNKPLKVKAIDACIYHYGWVKSPEQQQAKQQNFHKLWHDDQWIKNHVFDTTEFDYGNIDSLRYFRGTHPDVMKDRIRRKNWYFDFDPTRKNFSALSSFLYFIEKKSGWRPGEYKNFKKI